MRSDERARACAQTYHTRSARCGPFPCHACIHPIDAAITLCAAAHSLTARSLCIIGTTTSLGLLRACCSTTCTTVFLLPRFGIHIERDDTQVQQPASGNTRRVPSPARTADSLSHGRQ